MLDSDSPRVRVTVAAANAAARRLTTAANVRAALKQTDASDDTLIESIIDRVSAECATFCNLARDISGAVPTFGAETLEATWMVTSCGRDSDLLLPWRVPLTSITSVVENGITLTTGTDYQTREGNILERLCNDAPRPWWPRKIVVVMAAGLTLPGSVPAELEGQVIEQVKYRYKSTRRDPSIRSENVPEVWQGSYAVAGGDSIGASGLLKSLEAALQPYARQAV